jgi:hypothetical protein
MSIRDRPTAPRSPWQNGCREGAIGSIRRECLGHVVVFGERHLRHLLRSYATSITRLARTFQSTRTRRRRERYIPLVAFCLRHFLADSIICMCVFDFRQAHLARSIQYEFIVERCVPFPVRHHDLPDPIPIVTRRLALHHVTVRARACSSAATGVVRVRLRAADLIRIRVEPLQFGIAIEFSFRNRNRQTTL